MESFLEHEVDFIPQDFSSHFPMKKILPYFTINHLGNLCSKIEKDLNLTTAQSNTLNTIATLIREFSQFMISGTALEEHFVDIPQDCYDFIVKCFTVETKKLFPILDLCRLFITIPTAANYFASHMEDSNDPHNLFGLLSGQILFLNESNCNLIMRFSALLIYNMFSSSFLVPYLLRYLNILLRIIDKSLTDSLIPQLSDVALKYCSDLLPCIAKVLAESNSSRKSEKLQVIYLCVKFMGFVPPVFQDEKRIETICKVNYNLIQAIATLIHHDVMLREKLLTTNIYWPIEEVSNAIPAKVNKQLSSEKQLAIKQLKDITEEMFALLAKPRFVSKMTKSAVDLQAKHITLNNLI